MQNKVLSTPAPPYRTLDWHAFDGKDRRSEAGELNVDRIQRLAQVYFVMFVAVVAIGYVPSFLDADGNLFGLFKLDLYDDSLHLASGIWAGIAGWRSRAASVNYFRIFGPLYFLDGVMGFFLGSGYLDFGIFLYGVLELPLETRFFANLPHLLIGGGAALIGYVLAKRAA
jgi:hypothetical protein